MTTQEFIDTHKRFNWHRSKVENGDIRREASLMVKIWKKAYIVVYIAWSDITRDVKSVFGKLYTFDTHLIKIFILQSHN